MGLSLLLFANGIVNFSETQILLTGSSGSQITKENTDEGNKFITKSWTRTPSLMSSFSWHIQKQEVCLLASCPSNQEAKSALELVLESFQFTIVDLEQGRNSCSLKQ